MNVLKKTPKHNYIVKSNSLVNAVYKMDINTIHLFNIVLRQITAKNAITDNGSLYTVTAKDFGRLVGIKQPTNQYRELKKAANEIWKAEVKIQEKERYTKYRMIDTARYAVGDGYVSIAFARNFLPFIQELGKDFTRLKLAETLRLRKPTSIKLYEKFMQYRSDGAKGWYEEDLDDLKRFLNIEPNHIYWQNMQFNSKVLNPAIKEITKQLQWNIKIIKKKVGRRIVSVRFEYNDPNNGGLFGEQYQNRIEEGKKAKARELDQAEKSRQKHLKKYGINQKTNK